MFNKYVGIKGDLGFSTFSTKAPQDLSQIDKSYVNRISLEGILSISELANFNTRKFGLNFHTGVGIAAFSNPSAKKENSFFKENDHTIDWRVGLNPQYHISDHFSLDLDYSFNMLAIQDVTIDRATSINNDRMGMTNFSTLTVGLTYWFKAPSNSTVRKGRYPMRFKKVDRFSL